MTEKIQLTYFIDKDGLPEKFPTHRHDASFFESLGRTVATFGFLEEVILKAIFSFSATKPYPQDKIEEAYAKWQPMLEKSLSDTLGNLIATYGKLVRNHPSATITNLDHLLENLREASRLRNVICHGAWQPPNANGASVPFFINRKKEIFETAVDCNFLDQLQKAAAELSCEVIDTVTLMGWQFPGSNGPGKNIFK